MSVDDRHVSITRRGLLAATTAGVAAWPLTRSAPAAPDERALGAPEPTVSQPLLRDTVRLGVMQLPCAHTGERRGTALARIAATLERAYSAGQRYDLLWCHADALLPPPGRRSARALLTEAIALEGPELAHLADCARTHGCYLGFGARLRDPDWPGHVPAANLLLDPRGQLVAVHWQARHARTRQGHVSDPGVTVVEDVLEAYLARYGPEAVLPVTATPLGNLAMHSVAGDPELLRVLARRGCELLLRSAASGDHRLDAAAGSLHNGMFTAVAGRAGDASVSSGVPGDLQSTVFGPRGEVLAAAQTTGPQCVTARLPMAALRANRTLPPVAALVAAAAQPRVLPNRSSSSRSS
ncbi:MAG: hypothetical protein EA371_06330 [Gammaproteobacteria bacterium]|nr:MAG: hypothetical protein EA371_06330 [Gammaproteobacteria bacterium]